MSGFSFLGLFLLLVVFYFWGRTVRAGLDPENPESFERTIRWLKQGSAGQLYLDIVGSVVDKASDWIGDRRYMNQAYTLTPGMSTNNNFCHRLFGYNPFTAISFEKFLTLSLLYPLIAFLFAWGFGEALPGNSNLFFDNSDGTQPTSILARLVQAGLMVLLMGGGLWLLMRWRGPRRWLLLAIMFITWTIVIIFYNRMTSTGELSVKELQDNYFVFLGMFWLLFLGFFGAMYVGGALVGWWLFRSRAIVRELIYQKAMASAIIFTFVVMITAVAAITKDYSVAVVGVVAIAVAISATVIAAIGVSGAILVAVVLDTPLKNLKFVHDLLTWQVVFGIISVALVAGIATVLFDVLYRRSLKRKTAGWFWLAYSVLFICLAYVALSLVHIPLYQGWILFWLIMPLINAPLNWLSFGMSRGLLQAVRAGRHSGQVALAWALADLLLALVFILLISASIVWATNLANVVVEKGFIHLSLEKIHGTDTPLDNWWVYFIFFSALIPTLVHFALAGGAATLLLPRKVRSWLTADLATDKHKMSLAWVYITFMPIIGFFLAPAGLIFLLWSLMSDPNSVGTLSGLVQGWIDWLSIN